MTRTGYYSPVCRQCGGERQTRNPKRAACNACLAREARERRRKKRESDPKGVAERKRREHLKYTFGITMDDYDALLASQSGKCAACGTSTPGAHGRFVIDHDHKHGHIRGLLCNSCNVAAGQAKDDPAILRQIADYLDRTARDSAAEEVLPSVHPA